MEKIKKIIFSRKNLKRDIFVIPLFFIATVSIASAGNLDSPGSPGATSYTLSDIYTRLTTNATAVENAHSFSPSADPVSSFHTLKEIYDAIPTINPALVKFGQSYLGITGTLTPNDGTAGTADLFNGKTANLTGDWIPDAGTLNLACNTNTFDATDNKVPDAYDGGGDGSNRWCMKDTGNAVAGEILSNQKAWVDGLEVSGTMTNVGQQNITPGTASQTITQGYHNGTGAVSGDPDLVAGKIKSGENIFGVAGEYPSASYYLPGDTGATDATAAEICNTDEAWTKEGTKIAGTLNPTAATIGVGNTYCGTAGMLLKNEYAGSAGNTTPDYALYTQALGGIEDYNRGKTVMPDGAYSSTWTDCSVGDNCGLTGADIALADKKDDSTKLIWSKWLDAGAGHTWFWANNCYEPGTASNPSACAADGDNGCGCVKIVAPDTKVGCESIGDGHWRTPYQKELLQAYIDGAWGNLTNGVFYYWSATTSSGSTSSGWRTVLGVGNTDVTVKTGSVRVRCVR